MNDAPNIQWIADNNSLAQACQAWQAHSYLGLDTEFIRTNTFYPIPGLIQAGHGDDIALIDPQAITDWTPFCDIFENHDIIKVMHAAGEDLEVFLQLLETLPSPMFDTQLAASFLGTNHCMGYQRLIEQLLGINLAKDQTRSNWLARPLTDNQIQYAALDVFYLNRIYPILSNQLKTQHRIDWHEEDCARLIQSAPLKVAPDEAWRNVKLAWKLNPRQLAALRAICAFREQTAKKNNVPRKKVIQVGSLWTLARFQPDSLDQLQRIEQMTPACIRRYGEAILSCIREAQKLSESALPERLPTPLPSQVKPWIQAIRNYCITQTETLYIARELIPIKSLANDMVREYLTSGQFTVSETLLETLSNWRKEFLLKGGLIEHLNTLQKQSQE